MNAHEQKITPLDPLAEGHVQPEAGKELLRLVHHHPGYLRIQADAFTSQKGDKSVVSVAQAAAEAVPGFLSWSHNPRTGSVVVKYDPSILEADDLLKHIAKEAGLRGVENATDHRTNRQELVGTFLDSVQGINQAVSKMTGDRADLRELAPVALAAVSVVSYIFNDDRGRLPDWNNALYHSYRVFMHWHRNEVRTREKNARREDESNESDRMSGYAP